MSKRFIFTVLIGVFTVIVALLSMYLSQFGSNFSTEQAVWGAFGDYVGGILNPLFALLGLLGILHSLHLQRNQLKDLANDRKSEEVISAIKDIDSQIKDILSIIVGSADAHGSSQRVAIHISDMAAEAARFDNFLEAADSYVEFVHAARIQGGTLEIPAREIAHLMSVMATLAQRHPRHSTQEYSLIVSYYIMKTSKLIPMMKHIGGLQRSTIAFFEKGKTSI
ncbi:hypothetical protein YA0002_22450 [Pseudomonas cichorii]|uniref:hypothetical protein n=1 Tax=Pseudomonas cichorii TaxID=36746 RepID=UPI0018E60498|nr:hypothetical protein [Pseudomonas cichorii]MBI6855527.1 hypothetical protein [Pseudomonas cichorii]